MITREEIVFEARTWIGTPWRHNAAVKGVGCDCAGIIRGVYIALGIGFGGRDVSSWPGIEKFLSYSMKPDGRLLQAGCEQYLIPVAQHAMRPGDIALMIVDREPQHLGIIADYRYGGLSIIHASNTPSVKPARVIETRLMFSRAMRFVSAYSFPGVE